MRQEEQFQTTFCFTKALCKSKWSVPLIYFDRPPLGHTIKVNFITSQTVDKRYAQL